MALAYNTKTLVGEDESVEIDQGILTLVGEVGEPVVGEEVWVRGLGLEQDQGLVQPLELFDCGGDLGG